MDKLLIFIPTFRRVDRQITLSSLPKGWQARTLVVCPPDEWRELSRLFPDVHSFLTPSIERVPNIAAKRAWIFGYCEKAGYNKIIQFDDDLRFSHRALTHSLYAGYNNGNSEKWPSIVKQNKDYGRIHDASASQINIMLNKIENMLDLYRHGGISQRFMNHVHGHEWIMNHKATHALAYHVPTVLKNCKLNNVRMFEDLDYTLQLFLKGFPNAIYQWGATNDPKGFNAPGGESLCRQMADISAGADRMQELYPEYVNTVSRKVDAEKFGGKRIIVRWKKAIEHGMQAKGVEL